MKTSVNIPQLKVGLVTKSKNIDRVILPGKHWLWLNEQVSIVDATVRFQPTMNINVFRNKPSVASFLTFIDVADNEVLIVMVNGQFNEALSVGTYAFWNNFINYTFIKVDKSEGLVSNTVPKAVLQNSRISTMVETVNVEAYENALFFLTGEFKESLPPGTYWFWRFGVKTSVIKTDMRARQIEISGQELLTNDKANLRVNFNLIFKVENVEKAVIQCADYNKQLYALAQFAIRDYISANSLDELLEQKDTVNELILAQMRKEAIKIGVHVISCGIKDIILPGEIKQIMNSVLVAQKKAQANTIMRREETASTRSLLNTAKLMEENQMLMKLKEMEYTERIAEKINSITVSGGSQIISQMRDLFLT